MIIGVVSDSHDNRGNVRVAAKLLRSLGVEYLVHLGDVVAPFTLRDLLESVKPRRFTLVYGNNDGEKVGLSLEASKAGGRALDQPVVLKLDGRRILALHGFGAPDVTREVVESLAESRRWDAVLYGHTHEADFRYIRGVLLLNPGDLSGQLGKPSIALLDTSTMRARLIDLDVKD
ncbi:MAG: metallophosphoesterase [Desulfurococcales archaeon]|nr:metallophosphoesterase [Desulfurococcales archaeon]